MLSLAGLWLAIFYLAVVSCQRSIKVVRETPEEIYIESSAPGNTLGFLFGIKFGTLIVQAKAMQGNTTIRPSIFTILPNLLLEYNSSRPVTTSISIYTFLNFSNGEQNWGKGLALLKPTDFIYEVQGNWTHSSRQSLKFHTRMIMCTRPSLYQGQKLVPNEIRLIFSVVDFPSILVNSTLAYDQILLTGAALRNQSLEQTYRYTSGGAASLSINEAALVDGIPHAVIPGHIRDQNYWEPLLNNATAAKFAANLTVSDVLVGFAGSKQARNVTFFQRLAVNVSSIRGQGKDELDEGTSGTSSSGPYHLVLHALPLLLLSLSLLFL